jgi:flagellar hook-basal body complex protein FliE
MAMVNGIHGAVTQAASNWGAIGQGGKFLDSLKSAISDVDAQQDDAQTRVANLLEGKGEDVHTAMIAVERAQLSFQLMMQLRNKVVAAYQEVARMQF